MNMVKLMFNLIFILVLMTIHCNGKRSKQNIESVVKRGCVPLGGLCESANDCCGVDDPNTGHCVGCWQHGGYFIKWGHSRCGCDVTGSVTIDHNTHAVTSDMCNGHDATNTRCVTRVAPPEHRYYRGKKLFWYVN